MTAAAHPSEMTEEVSYVQGSRMAWLQMLQICLRELGRDSEEWGKHRWIMEREQTIHLLRRLCADFGDNDWPDDMHLTDIIDKHLRLPRKKDA